MNDFREYSAAFHVQNGDVIHFGILGMKWGVRRYQNPDGTLTEAGKKRYNSELSKMYKVPGREWKYHDYQKASKKISNKIPRVKEIANEGKNIINNYNESNKRVNDLEDALYKDKEDFAKACDYISKKEWKEWGKTSGLSRDQFNKLFTNGDMFQYEAVDRWFKSGKSKYSKDYEKALKENERAFNEYKSFIKDSMQKLGLNYDDSQYSIDQFQFEQLMKQMTKG